MPADRRSLPDIWTPAVPVGIRGILAPPPEHRQKLGSADPLNRQDWPQLVTYLELEAVSGALEASLPSWVIWLSADDPNGFEDRDWSPAAAGPERHQAYAVQWFALSATALVIWMVLKFRAGKRQSRNDHGS